MIKRRIVWLLLWILSLIGISTFGGTITYGFFFAVTLVPVVSFAYLVAEAVGVKIYQELGSRTITCDERVDYFFVLKNETPFSFPSVKVELNSDNYHIDSISNDIEYELLPGENRKFITTLSCKYRGEYPVGVESITVADGLNLFKWKYKLSGNFSAIVNPKIVMLDELSVLNDTNVFHGKDNLKGTDTPDIVVRDYVPGDSMRHINWKATAKSDTIKVRKFYDEENEGIFIYCDNKRYSTNTSEYLPLENKILETLLAVTGYFAYKNREIRAIDSKGEMTVTDAKNFEIFYQKICGISFYEANDEVFLQVDFINKCIRNSAQFAFFVVHEIADEVISRLDELSSNGINVVFYIITKDFSNEFYRYGNEYIKFIVIDPEEDLKTVL